MMVSRTVLLLLLAATLAAPTGALAFGGGGCGEGSCSDCHSMEMKEAEKLLTGLTEKVHAVDFATVPGLWKVDVENKGTRGSVYIDFSKSYLITGRVLRLADWTDVTPGSKTTLRKVDYSRIPLGDALLLGREDARVKAVVFTDPKCPFCDKLHKELQTIIEGNPEIAFYIKLFPLKIHPDAYRISKSIVCSQSMEMLEASFAGAPIPQPTCETEAVDKTIVLGREFGIRSTPTLVLPDGRVLPGFKPAAKLVEILTASPKKTQY